MPVGEGRTSAGRTWYSGQLVPGFVHRGPYRIVVDGRPALDGDAACRQIDVDGDDAVDLGDLVTNRADAVVARHPGHGVGRLGHQNAPEGGDGASAPLNLGTLPPQGIFHKRRRAYFTWMTPFIHGCGSQW